MPGLRFLGSSRLREPPRAIILRNCNRQSTLSKSEAGRASPGDLTRRKGGGGWREAREVCQKLAEGRAVAGAGAASPASRSAVSGLRLGFRGQGRMGSLWMSAPRARVGQSRPLPCPPAATATASSSHGHLALASNCGLGGLAPSQHPGASDPSPAFPGKGPGGGVAHRTIQGHPASGSGLQGGTAQRVPKEGVQEAGRPVQGLAGPAWCRRTPARARSPSRSLKYLRSGAGRGLRQEPRSCNASGVFWPRGRLSLPGGRGSFGS